MRAAHADINRADAGRGKVEIGVVIADVGAINGIEPNTLSSYMLGFTLFSANLLYCRVILYRV